VVDEWPGNSKSDRVRVCPLCANQSMQDTHPHIGLIETVAIAGRVLAAHGQDDFTRGHISMRLPDDPGRFIMKAHSTGLDEITPQNILTIGLDGEVVAGTARRHSEVYIHSEILKARADVNCVIHTHPVHCIALSATGRPLRCYSQPAALFYEGLGVYDGSIRLIRSPQMGADVARALGPHRAVLLKNHGIVTAGATVAEAVISALMLENAAKVQMLVEAAGDPAPEFPHADIQALKDMLSKPDQFAVNFDYLVRQLT
jgi:L-fuculose-phosphate aldolase